MNNTNGTGFDDVEFENDDVDGKNRRIMKIDAGNYVLLIYFICLVMLFFHFLLFFHILFGFKTLKDTIRRMLVKNKVSHKDGWTVEPVDK